MTSNKTDRQRAIELLNAIIDSFNNGQGTAPSLIAVETAFAEIRKECEAVWMPIESAPEDTIVWINVTDHGLSCSPNDMCLAVLDCGLWHGCGSYSNMMLSETPTKWMPLPAAPKEA